MSTFSAVIIRTYAWAEYISTSSEIGFSKGYGEMKTLCWSFRNLSLRKCSRKISRKRRSFSGISKRTTLYLPSQRFGFLKFIEFPKRSRILASRFPLAVRISLNDPSGRLFSSSSFSFARRRIDRVKACWLIFLHSLLIRRGFL